MFLDSSLETSLVYQFIMGASKELPLWEQYQEEDDPSTNYKKQKTEGASKDLPLWEKYQEEDDQSTN